MKTFQTDAKAIGLQLEDYDGLLKVRGRMVLVNISNPETYDELVREVMRERLYPGFEIVQLRRVEVEEHGEWVAQILKTLLRAEDRPRAKKVRAFINQKLRTV